jgi:integrase/recombinase XerD
MKKAKPSLHEPESFTVHREAYLNWMRVHNYALSTVDRVDYMLGKFMAWCAERGITRPRDVTRRVLERYQQWLYAYRGADSRPLRMSTQANHLIPVCGFFRWLAKERFLVVNPASELELPRKERHLPHRVLTVSKIEVILNQPDVSRVMGLRDRAILETFYATGIRRQELANLRVYDLYMEQETLVVRQGKGKKDRVVPIGSRALAWIGCYLSGSRPELVGKGDEGLLFVSKSGRPLSAEYLSVLTRKYLDQAGVKQGACHLFRHSTATLMLENGADIRFIQQLLGHAKLETTQIYTEVSIKALKEVHKRTHPAG